jgi:hypothetical protein
MPSIECPPDKVEPSQSQERHRDKETGYLAYAQPRKAMDDRLGNQEGRKGREHKAF